jgi:hypothetical protein
MARAVSQGRKRETGSPVDGASRSQTRRAGPGRRRPAATIARWPIEVDEAAGQLWSTDASVTLVRSMIDDYRGGLADRAAEKWHDDVLWRVLGEGPLGGDWLGRERVLEYHRLAERLSDGDYRQRLIALEGSRGSIVNGYLRTEASRGERRIDMPTLVVFEIAGGRIRRVTELPGDRAAWAAFWSD